MDVDHDGITDVLLVAAPMFLGAGNREAGKVYVYSLDGVRERNAFQRSPQWHIHTLCHVYFIRG